MGLESDRAWPPTFKLSGRYGKGKPTSRLEGSTHSLEHLPSLLESEVLDNSAGKDQVSVGW